MRKTLQRKVLRLNDYDYSQEGAYFVTICTQNRGMLLGQICDGQMVVNSIGRIIQKVWDELAFRFSVIGTDAFVIMPNHVHGIIIVGAQFIAPFRDSMNRAPTLGDIVRTFKAISSRMVRKEYPEFSWQRNYYEHVIRDDDSLNRIRDYILTNPRRWELDRENPNVKGKDDFDIWLENFKRERLSAV